MFRGFGFQNFQQDPFFAGFDDQFRNFDNQFRGFDNQFRSFDNMLSFDPFTAGRNRDPFPAVEGARAPVNDRRVAEHGARTQEISPFGFGNFGNLFGGFGRMFDSVERQLHQVSHNPNATSFTQTSVTSYSNTGDGTPKVYQATTSTRQAGDTRETRKAVRDSQRGIEKLEVGHHIGDRGHIVERERNLRTGQQHDHADYVGMSEDASADFNEEWRRKTRPGHHIRHQPEEMPVTMAITDGRDESDNAGHDRNTRSGGKYKKHHYDVDEA